MKALPLSRRQFVKTSTLALGAAALSRASAQVSPGETLRVGLVGCGGRGTGAAAVPGPGRRQGMSR